MLLVLVCVQCSTNSDSLKKELQKNKFYAYTQNYDGPPSNSSKEFGDSRSQQENFVERKFNCHDHIDSEKKLNQDTSELCIQEQIELAHKVFQVGPVELPQCILKQETTGYDVYSTSQNGNGLGQITVSTWNSLAKQGNDLNSDERTLLQRCVVKLSENTPWVFSPSTEFKLKNYTNRKQMALDLEMARTKKPDLVIQPYYRDHAICMHMLTLYTKNKSLSSKSAGTCVGLSKAYGPIKGSDQYVRKVCKCVNENIQRNKLDQADRQGLAPPYRNRGNQ